MEKIKRLGAVFTFVFLLLTSESVAEGIRIGANSGIFPSLALGIRYDDNILFVPPEDVVGPESDIVFLASPALWLKVEPTNLKFNLGYTLNSLLYADMGSPEESHHQFDSLNHQGNLYLLVQTNPGFFTELLGFVEYREATWEEELYQSYYPTTMLHEDSLVWLGYKKGPYSNLFVRAGYENIWDYKPEREFDFFDRVQHRGLLDFKFRFLPRTAVVFDTMVGQLSSPNPVNLELYSPEQRAQLPNGFGALYYQGLLGLETNLTTALLIRLLGGYASWNYEQLDDYNGFIMDTELALDYEKRGRIGIGYRRFVEDSIMTNYRLIDIAYLEAWGVFFRRIKPRLVASYQIRHYAGISSFDEDFLTIAPNVEVKILEWLSSKLDYSYEWLLTTVGNSSIDRARNSVTLSFLFRF